MNFVLIIRSLPATTYSALKFIESALQLQHQISCVFFHQQAVTIANRYLKLPQDEVNIQFAWQVMAQQHSLPLIVCSGSAMRYGIQLANLAGQFMLGSLGQLSEAINAADKVCSF